MVDGTVADYECKVKNLVFLCRTFETEVVFGTLSYYRVAYQSYYRSPGYFRITEKYAFWK